MRVFAIGDLHLEGGSGKTMDRFGENWRNHDAKIFEAWERLVGVDDLVLVLGDTSWAMRLADAMPDLERVGRMKGHKLLLKGNHDYWWQSLAKLTRALDSSIEIVNGSSTIINRVAISGTRGWTCPNDLFFEERDLKIYEREVGRLKAALESLRGRETEYDSLIVALHYPPTNDKHDASGFTELIDEFRADVCVYGHVHGEFIQTALTGLRGQTMYRLVSADAVNFSPYRIELNRAGRNN
jgi:predicted phosphohydrolase